MGCGASGKYEQKPSAAAKAPGGAKSQAELQELARVQAAVKIQASVRGKLGRKASRELDSKLKVANNSSGIDGSWRSVQESEAPQHVKLIHHNTLTAQNGDITQLKNKTTDGFEMELKGDTYKAELKADGKIYWSDGDIWVRSEALRAIQALMKKHADLLLGLYSVNGEMQIIGKFVRNTKYAAFPYSFMIMKMPPARAGSAGMESWQAFLVPQGRVPTGHEMAGQPHWKLEGAPGCFIFDGEHLLECDMPQHGFNCRWAWHRDEKSRQCAPGAAYDQYEAELLADKKTKPARSSASAVPAPAHKAAADVYGHLSDADTERMVVDAKRRDDAERTMARLDPHHPLDVYGEKINNFGHFSDTSAVHKAQKQVTTQRPKVIYDLEDDDEYARKLAATRIQAVERGKQGRTTASERRGSSAGPLRGRRASDPSSGMGGIYDAGHESEHQIHRQAIAHVRKDEETVKAKRIIIKETKRVRINVEEILGAEDFANVLSEYSRRQAQHDGHHLATDVKPLLRVAVQLEGEDIVDQLLRAYADQTKLDAKGMLDAVCKGAGVGDMNGLMRAFRAAARRGDGRFDDEEDHVF